MTPPTLDDLLRSSAPAPISDDPVLRARVERMTARPTPARRTRRRVALALPMVVVGALALTAGAAVVADDIATVDVTIPVSYVTDTGVQVDCELLMSGGTAFDPGSTTVPDLLREQDWTGIGQRIYEHALAHPWTPSDDSWEVYADNPEAVEMLTWLDAQQTVVLDPIADEVMAKDADWVWLGDACPGTLH